MIRFQFLFDINKKFDHEYQILLCDYHRLNARYNKLIDYYKTKIKNVPDIKPKYVENLQRKDICYLLLFDALGWYVAWCNI
ncbi:hypothetical protein QLL95_gp0112 [Cotonvirus japonicus]|uniref:Uncharacterized protein n=1 Tax=Cotonvirus japonicus TaxID=2811091 RepID=A0ABM7NR19_9VIRU|nr:hypothetical protein QLL95_gp0112 [Cotonvirus japonicus]BCS82601.1 hypothetical protein [Cotonvirus japonicus]